MLGRGPAKCFPVFLLGSLGPVQGLLQQQLWDIIWEPVVFKEHLMGFVSSKFGKLMSGAAEGKHCFPSLPRSLLALFGALRLPGAEGAESEAVRQALPAGKLLQGWTRASPSTGSEQDPPKQSGVAGETFCRTTALGKVSVHDMSKEAGSGSRG